MLSHLALRQFVDDGPGELVVDLHHNLLNRLQPFAAFSLLVQYLRGANTKLKALAAHVLHENAQLQLAPAHDIVGLRSLGRLLDLDADVGLSLGHQALPNHLRRHLGRQLVLPCIHARTHTHTHTHTHIEVGQDSGSGMLIQMLDNARGCQLHCLQQVVWLSEK